jgi:hypothetical protein
MYFLAGFFWISPGFVTQLRLLVLCFPDFTNLSKVYSNLRENCWVKTKGFDSLGLMQIALFISFFWLKRLSQHCKTLGEISCMLLKGTLYMWKRGGILHLLIESGKDFPLIGVRSWTLPLPLSRSRHKNPPPHMPHDPCMLRFMIMFALWFPKGKAHELMQRRGSRYY